MQLAALGSLCLHAALLLVPVSGSVGGDRWRGHTAGDPIHATLRGLTDEPAWEAAPDATPAPPTRPEPQPEVPAARETARPPEPSGVPEPAGSVTIPGAYVDAKQLNELPRPLTEPPLDLLRSILARPGAARLMLYIDQSGKVTSVEVDASTLPPEATERAVLIFSGMRFEPGRIGGLAVRSRVPITVGAEERVPGD